MKKMMMVVAIVACAMMAQASSYMWKLSTGATYAGMSVYAVTGSSAASLIALCESGTETDWALAVAGVTPVTATSGSRGAAAGTLTGVTTGDNFNFVIVNGSIAEGKSWYVTADKAVGATFDPPASGTANTIAVSIAGSGSFTAGGGGIPEPTSGLLLVLGGAMLALRRKQK